MKSHRIFAIASSAILFFGCAPKYQVGDLYEQDGKTGVVFCTTDGGRHGKIISLSEAEAAWQTGRGIEAVGAADERDGQANLAVIASQPDWQKRFPAFAWCAGLGEGWYLPSIGEFEQLEENYRTVETALTQAGGTSIGSHFYWTSTEANDYGAILWRGAGIPQGTNTKIYTMYVRAAAAF